MMRRTIGRRTGQLPYNSAAARRWPLALICALLLACGSLAQERRPEPPPTPDVQPAEASAAEKAPDPNQAVAPAAPGDPSGARGSGDQSVNGNIVFTSPGQFLYPRDVRLSDSYGVLRFFAADALTASPAGAAVQLFGNNTGAYSGQMYIDSGAHDNAALIFRTAKTGGTLAERMRITADGLVTIGTKDVYGGLTGLKVQS